ncbi:MAG: hypothetical protein WDZ39_00775, partial [Candidatus Spechtbacterales bacterium]
SLLLRRHSLHTIHFLASKGDSVLIPHPYTCNIKLISIRAKKIMSPGTEKLGSTHLRIEVKNKGS